MKVIPVSLRMRSPSRRNRSSLASGKPTSAFAVWVASAIERGVMLQIGSMMFAVAPSSKMRRKKIATYQAANQYLEKEYCDDHNQRFAIDAASETDYHLPMPSATKLREIFRLETERTLGNDWVVRHDNHFYQVEAQNRNHAPAKSKVTVCEWEDGTIEIHYRGGKLSWTLLPERPAKPEVVTQNRSRPVTPAAPLPNHPWRRSYQDMQALASPDGAEARFSVASASAPP